MLIRAALRRKCILGNGKSFGNRRNITSVKSLAPFIAPSMSEGHVSPLLAVTADSFQVLHTSLSIPWYGAIVLGTIGLRTAITLPLSLYQRKRLHKALTLQPLLQSWSSIIQRKARSNSSYEQAEREYTRQYREKIKQIYREHGCDPMGTRLLPLVQIPLFLIVSLSLRGMADASTMAFGLSLPLAVQDLQFGGFGCISDLTLPDSTWILPIAFGLTNLANIELHNRFLKRVQKIPTLSQKVLLNVSRALCLVFIPVASQTPSAVCIYWATSSVYSLLQNVAFQRWMPPPKTSKEVLASKD